MKLALLALLFAAQLCAEPHIENALAAFHAGELAANDRRFDQAIQQFHRAIEIEPTYHDAFESLIRTCLAAGRSSDAALAMTELLEIEPSLTQFRLLLGQILLQQNQTERALAQFSLVLKNDPTNADALAGFATAAGKLGMASRAADAREQGRKQHPLDPRFKS